MIQETTDLKEEPPDPYKNIDFNSINWQANGRAGKENRRKLLEAIVHDKYFIKSVDTGAIFEQITETTYQCVKHNKPAGRITLSREELSDKPYARNMEHDIACVIAYCCMPCEEKILKEKGLLR